MARKHGTAITERERIRRERVVLRRRFALAEELERQQIAQQLHDSIGQQLTAVSLGLRAISDLAPPGSEVDTKAAELRRLMSATGQELHALAVRLRPQALDEFGLAAAVEAYACDWSRQTGIALELHLRIGAVRLPRELEFALYRIVQEALVSIAKHAGAGGASLVVEQRHGTICAVIADDGCRLDWRAHLRPRDASDLGLHGIRERAALLGGSTDVECVSGGGTSLSIRIPLHIISPDPEPAELRE